jgi:lipoyl(octanoyl) transferase
MIEIIDAGAIDYNEAWDMQRSLVADIQKNRNRNVLILCQHPSVITIGRNGTNENIVCHQGLLDSAGIKTVETDRGGDVTLHNPGQLVGYPIFNLEDYQKDLHWFLRRIEDCIIELIANYGIEGDRVEDMTGVWIDGRRKICAMGLHCSRWVTSHGFALNVNNDLREFNYIIPCGITGKEVTSITKEIGGEVDFAKIMQKCGEIFMNKF